MKNRHELAGEEHFNLLAGSQKRERRSFDIPLVALSSFAAVAHKEPFKPRFSFMPASDPIQILLTHDRWATGQILSICATLTDEQFHRRFDIGHGSLHDTVTHILAAMQVLGDLLAAREQRPRLEGTRRSLTELTSLHTSLADEIALSARTFPLDSTVTRQRGDQSYTLTRAEVLTHVATHAMHHRAQCLNMLRQLGVSPLPKSSVVEWVLAGEPSH
jgi:uncharacterized damage-inducible protein DinB